MNANKLIAGLALTVLVVVSQSYSQTNPDSAAVSEAELAARATAMESRLAELEARVARLESPVSVATGNAVYVDVEGLAARVRALEEQLTPRFLPAER